MTLGRIEEFVLERLEPRAGKELSGGDLFIAYRRWCAEKRLVALKRDQFSREFADVAAETGIMFSGTGGNGVYRDVGVSARARVARAS